MKKLFILMCLTLVSAVGFSQHRRVPKRIKLKLELVDTLDRVHFGYLAALPDSGIMMLPSEAVFDQKLTSSSLNTIPYQNIQEVILRRKGSVGKGIAIGSISGFFVGAVIGAAMYQSKPGTVYGFDVGVEGEAIGIGFLGAVGGAVVGGIIGSAAKKTFIIGGNRDKFHRMKKNVLDMTYSY